MNKKITLKAIFYFTLSYLFIFTILAIYGKNYEFLYYTVVLSTLLLLVIFNFKKIHLPISIMVLSTIVGAMHFAGGSLVVNGIRLYDTWIIYNFFKYDNLVHMVSTFCITYAIYSLLHPQLKEDLKHNRFYLSLLLVLIASGVGALNEILELGAVIFFNASKQVGDYYNNAFDLVYNFLGAFLSCFYLMYYYKKKIY